MRSDGFSSVTTVCGTTDCVSHTHSYCGTLRGLLLYGLTTGDRRAIDAVADVHATVEYRQHLAAVLTRRALVQALAKVKR
jgi:hypothetical protein